MIKRFLSHALIGVATFVLTGTLFVWALDARMLEPSVVDGELRKAGVSQEIANLLPQAISSSEEITAEEKLTLMDQVARSINTNYVDQKLYAMTDALTSYIKTGEAVTVIDLTDFPSQLEANGVVIDDEFRNTYATPIKLESSEATFSLTNTYKVLSAIKWAGIAVFIGLIMLEWILVEKGKKLRRISRVFFYAGASYLFYWAILVFSPGRLGAVLKNNVQATYDVTGLIDAILRTFNGLFSSYFLSYALGCFSVALALYAVRHYRDGDVGKSEVTSPAPQNKKSKSIQ